MNNKILRDQQVPFLFRLFHVRHAYLIALLILLGACKVSKQVSQSTSQQPEKQTTVPVKADTVYLITQLGDTLSSLDEEVAIDISRLLPDTVRIAAVGDLMNGTNFPNASYLPKDTGSYLWNDAKDLLANADITFGNLEGTLLNKGGDQKKCNNPKLCYLFRSPEYLAENYRACGFDLLSVANNHANDFGRVGRLNTQKVLDSLGIAHAGSIEQPYTIQKIGYLKVGFCAFAPNAGTMSIHDYDTIVSIIQFLDSVSDIVIASFHAGAEGVKNQHVTRKREFYYGEDRGNVYELGHLMVDSGADVILGHGPHVPRALEVYNERIIAYSLGNFLTYGRFNLKGATGEAPLLVLETDAQGAFLKGRIHAFRQSYTLGPRNDPKLSAIKSIQRLSLNDFPENPIAIMDDGNILYVEQ